MFFSEVDKLLIVALIYLRILMTPFNRFLTNTLFAGIVSNTIWFALTFWIYLEIGSLTISSLVAAIFPLTSSVLSIFFGQFVDNRSKKTSMVVSSAFSLIAFIFAGLVFAIVPEQDLLNGFNPLFWIAAVTILMGVVANNLRMITLSTLVTELIDQEHHDKANGRIGIVNGVSFAMTSIFSGILISTVGMTGVVYIMIIISALILLDCSLIPYQSKVKKNESLADEKKHTLREGLKYMVTVPGLFALILFTTFNNFLGGVFMALVDPYGLELVSVQFWGFAWVIPSLGFVLGGILVSRYGLGKSPLRAMMITNGIIWFATILFPIYSNIWITIAGLATYMILFPYIEAAEQTVIQRVVEPDKQGRVFGIAQSIEMLASPITAITIGPLTQEVILPFLSDGVGFDLIGGWFGSDIVRAMAFVFIVAGFVGVVATIIAINTTQYKSLSKVFVNNKVENN